MPGMQLLDSFAPRITKNAYWLFSHQLTRKMPVDFFKPVVEKHLNHLLEYQVLCTQLIRNYLSPTPNQERLTKQSVAALEMAELLAYLFEYYLYVPREVLRLQEEQKILRGLLRKRGFQFYPENDFTGKKDTATQTVRTEFFNWNNGRLLSLRSKRVFGACVPFVQNCPSYVAGIAWLDKLVNPIFAYFSWIFFIPRLAVNLFLLGQNVIAGPWMSDTAKKLGSRTRLVAQLQRRWPEIFNDLIWMIAGILGCFVLLGPLAPIGVAVTVTLYIYDVFLASLRAGIEITRLHGLQKEYATLAEQLRATEGEHSVALADLQDFQNGLAERVLYEKKRLTLSIINTTVLAIGILLCMPAAAVLTPILPLIGTCVLLAMTIINFILVKLLENSRPKSNLKVLADKEDTVSADADFFPKSTYYEHQRLFKPAPPVAKEIFPEMLSEIPAL